MIDVFFYKCLKYSATLLSCNKDIILGGRKIILNVLSSLSRDAGYVWDGILSIIRRTFFQIAVICVVECLFDEQKIIIPFCEDL